MSVFVHAQGIKNVPAAQVQGGGGALCVQMDFTRTFQTNTKCNNTNHV